MATETLRLEITAENRQAIAALKQTAAQTQQLGYSLDELKGSLKATKAELQTLTDRNQIAATNREIGVLKSEIAQLEGSVQSGKNAFVEMYGAVRKIAYVLPGIGIAGIFNLAFEGIGKAAEGLGLFSKKLTDVQKAYENYNETVKAANKDAGEQISTLKILYGAATDVNLSIQERIKAANELKKTYPDQFQNMTTEQIMLGQAKKSYDELTKSIVQNARAKAAKDQLDKIEAQRLDAEYNKVKILAMTNKEMREAKSYNTGGEADVTISAEEQIQNAKNRQKAALKIQDDILKGLDAQESVYKKFASESSFVDALTTPEKKIKEKKKELSEFEIWLQAYYKRFASTHTNFTIDNEGQKEKDKYDPDKKRTLDQGRNIDMTSLFGEDHMTKGAEALKQYSEQMKVLVGLSEQWTNSLFAAIDAGKSMGEILNEVFKGIIKDIEKAIVKEAILAILMTVTGTAGSGSAAGSAGGSGNFIFDLVKKVFGKGKADGGLASGPKSGYLELLHGDEMVIPMDKMGKFVDHAMGMGAKMGGGMGGPQMVYVEGKISGNDIILAQRRADFSLGVRR